MIRQKLLPEGNTTTLLWQVLHIQEFLHQAPRALICAKALHRRAMARRVSGESDLP